MILIIEAECNGINYKDSFVDEYASTDKTTIDSVSKPIPKVKLNLKYGYREK